MRNRCKNENSMGRQVKKEKKERKKQNCKNSACLIQLLLIAYAKSPPR